MAAPARTINTIRGRTRGFNTRHIALGIAGRPRLRPAPKGGSLTTALTGTNNDLTFTTQDWRGASSNSIRIRYVVAGANTPLSVSVSGTDITVNIATNGSSVATSTAAQVRNAVNAYGPARDLVLASNAAGNDGTGVVTAMAFTALSGGTS